jgi:hypothetical protein
MICVLTVLVYALRLIKPGGFRKTQRVSDLRVNSPYFLDILLGICLRPRGLGNLERNV